MKWSPPRIERRRSFAVASFLLNLSMTLLIAGCSAVPALRSTGLATVSPPVLPKSSTAGTLVAPQFDIIPVTAAEPVAAAEPASPAAVVAPLVAPAAVAALAPSGAVTSNVVPSSIMPATSPTGANSAGLMSAVPGAGSQTHAHGSSIVAPKPVETPKDPVAVANEKAVASKTTVAANEPPKDAPTRPEPQTPVTPSTEAPKPEVNKPVVQVAEAAKPDDVKPDVAASAHQPGAATAAFSGSTASQSSPATKTDIAMSERSVQQSSAPPSGKSAPAKPEAVKPDSTKVASAKPSGVVVTPPKAFAWERDGKSAGDRPFLIASPGDDGYRTLVVGSVGGNDPVALALVDQLAKRLHDDSVILGGFDCTIIRTLNPDGEANYKFLNQKGQYLNEGFPVAGTASSGAKPSDVQPPEVTFLLEELNKLQPQRVVHIRTVKGTRGVLAASEGCRAPATEAAEWLKFDFVSLPEGSRAARSLEKYISTTGSSDMIMFGLPESTPKDELWDRFGDTLLNLLLGDDTAAREMARKSSQQSSADRRNQSPGK